MHHQPNGHMTPNQGYPYRGSASSIPPYQRPQTAYEATGNQAHMPHYGQAVPGFQYTSQNLNQNQQQGHNNHITNPRQQPHQPNQFNFNLERYLPHRFIPLRDPSSTNIAYQAHPTTHQQGYRPVEEYRPYNPHGFRIPMHQPPPPPPPSAYHYPTNGVYTQQPPHRGVQQYRQKTQVNSTPQAQPKRKRFDFFCDSCSKGFECEEDYDIHIAEDHVTCSHPGCGFSGREDVVRAHKLKHTVNTDSPEEIEAWIAMRRFKFPRRPAEESSAPKLIEEPKTLSKLEKFIRNSMRQSAIEARKRRREKDQKQPCVHWERYGKCNFGDKCNFAHEKTGVCTFYLNHGRCRHGDNCKYKHVRQNSRELEEIRNPRGNLMKRLLGTEMHNFESAMLQCLRHMVNHGFYQHVNPEGEAPDSTMTEDPPIDDDEFFSDNDDDDEAASSWDNDLSPISTR